MADNPKKKGRDRELVSVQEHEIVYLMKTAKVTRQKALEVIREAGPRLEQFLAYRPVDCCTLSHYSDLRGI